MKSLLLKSGFLLGLALAPIAALGQIVFTVSGTVDATGNGFTAGDPVTFTFTLAQTASNTGSGSSVQGTYPSITDYKWADVKTSDPILWADVTGSPFIGTYERPAATQTSPSMLLRAYRDNPSFIVIRASYYLSGSMGLTFNGNIVSDIYVGANFNGLNFDSRLSS